MVFYNKMDDLDVLKIDLDTLTRFEAIEILKERLHFLEITQILPKKNISDIVLKHKSKYSAIIYLKKRLKDPLQLIIMQSILGDDWKRTAITFRDYSMGIRNYNRLFDIKRYTDGSYKFGRKEDITKEVLN